jgi:hypothetical protein
MQADLVPSDLSYTPNGHLASTFKFMQKASLSSNRYPGLGMLQWSQKVMQLCILLWILNTQGTLSQGRKKIRRNQTRGIRCLQAKALESHRGHDYSVKITVFQLSEPRIKIPAQCMNG